MSYRRHWRAQTLGTGSGIASQKLPEAEAAEPVGFDASTILSETEHPDAMPYAAAASRPHYHHRHRHGPRNPCALSQ